MQVSRKTWLGVAAVALTMTACGSDSGDDSASGGLGVEHNDFGLAFSPIYSANDGQHTFQVPVVPQGGVAVDSWELYDSSGKKVTDAADFAKDASFGGAMITTKKAGDYTILAHAGKQTGCAKFTVTSGTPDQWNTGEARYNNSIMLSSLVPDMSMLMNYMLPKDISCKNCHGDGAMFLDVEHTPQQTGGYSDADLAKILTMGMKPTPPDPSIPAECTPYAYMRSKTGVPLAIYQWFHTWQATPDEVTGLVLYLRALKPETQGMLDFGGLMPPPPGGGTATPPAGAAGSGT
jgi:hypothetical protein